MLIGDIEWIEQHLNDLPECFMRGLLGRKFEDIDKRFVTLRDLGMGFKEIVRQLESYLARDPNDHLKWERLLNTEDERIEEIHRQFRLLWRGYTDEDVARVSSIVGQDKGRYISVLNKLLEYNEKLLTRARRSGKKREMEIYEKNRLGIEKIKEKVELAFTHPRVLAIAKLNYQVDMRRWGLSRIFAAWEGDYLCLGWTLISLEPSRLRFPPRFLMEIFAERYFVLLRKWVQSGSNQNPWIEFEGDVNSIFEKAELFSIYNEIEEKIGSNRRGALDELRECWGKGYYLATSLIAMTQTEGILWDFAVYLNRHGTRIFKVDSNKGNKRRPYIWNSDTKCYKVIDQNGRPKWDKTQNLTSARQLLETTRMGEFVEPKLLSYLVAEFYEDRSKLAHGEISRDLPQADAIAAIHALFYVLWSVKTYFAQRKPGRAS